MLKNKTITFLTIVFVFLFSVCGSVSGTAQEDQLAKAVQLFNKKSYNEAEPLFRQLLDNQPKNPILNYYYGSCQTENRKYSSSTLNYLLMAGNGDVPAKVDYYIGIQYQAENKWKQALLHYNKFRINTKKAEQDELKLAEKIQQCYNYENPYISEDPVKLRTNETNLILENDTFAVDSTTALQTNDTLPLNSPGTSNSNENFSMGRLIEFRINSDITYLNTANFRTEEGKLLFNEASAKQKELDNNLQKIDELREDYRLATLENEKKIIGDKILSFENDTYRLKDEITELLERSINLENNYWQNAPEKELADFKINIKKLSQTIAPPKPENDSTKVLPDTSVIIDPNILFNKMEVEKITRKLHETDELVYKIQIGAFSKGLPRYVDRLYKKLSVIRKIDHYTDENGVTVYTTGNLTNLDDAVKMQKQVRQEGIEDAFVVPYFNGKRITLEQAKEIAKEL